MRTTLLVFLLAISSFSKARSLAVPGGSSNNDSIKVQMIRDWERARAYTREYLEAMPEEGLQFKPTPDTRSFAEQMLHLAQGSIYLVSAGTGKARIYANQDLEKMDQYKQKDSLITVVMASYDFVIDAIKELDASKGDEVVKANSLSVSRFGWINKGFEHQTHHRGQCTVYLRMKGVVPPNEKLF